jgi:hypothetical protein
MFEYISRKVVLLHLEDLHLEFMRCEGEALKTFLENHSGLHKLSLSDLDITGPVGLREVLNTLHIHHRLLCEFECKQIALNARRLFFATMGNIHASSIDWEFEFDDEDTIDDACLASLEEFQEVECLPYRASAEGVGECPCKD